MRVLARLTRGGQISIPAEIRNRWRAERLEIEDNGDHLVVRPASGDDPIKALRGAFADAEDSRSFKEVWKEHKQEDREAEERKWGVLPNGSKWRDEVE